MMTKIKIWWRSLFAVKGGWLFPMDYGLFAYRSLTKWERFKLFIFNIKIWAKQKWCGILISHYFEEVRDDNTKLILEYCIYCSKLKWPK